MVRRGARRWRSRRDGRDGRAGGGGRGRKERARETEWRDTCRKIQSFELTKETKNHPATLKKKTVE